MDTTLVIMAFVLMSIIISPFLLHYLSQKKKEAKLSNELSRLAKSENAMLTQKEFWRQRYAIGIDESSKKILYVNKEQGTVIKLSEVAKCRINAVSRNAKTKNSNVTIIEKLDLIFTFHKSVKPEMTLQFYDSDEFFSTDNERVLIEKWLGVIKSNLKNGLE